MRSILLHTSATRRVVASGLVLLAMAGETLTVSEHDEDGEIVEHGEIDLADAEALVERGGAEWVEDEADPLDHDHNGEKGGSLSHDPPSLTGKNKAQLLEIAAAEGVAASEDMTNAQIVEAIEAKRAEA